jgi:DNA-directed RNA polymerase I, II, and III subunit RPABC2
MSDNESDYYSDSTSNSDDNVDEKVVAKKNVVLNAAKKFGNYIEDESEISDSESDDDDADDDENEDDEIDEEQIGGGKDKPDDGIKDADKVEIDDDADDDDDDDDDDIEINEDGDAIEKKPTKVTKPKKTTQLIIEDEDYDDDDDEYEENYLQKFDSEVNRNYIVEFHPECLNHNSDEVLKLSRVIRDDNNIIIDPLHKTQPYLTKYEKARILGQRSKQIETGAKPLVKVPENIIDSYVIAEFELREKKIPFVIKRPIPGGKFEYWNLKDLENINF